MFTAEEQKVLALYREPRNSGIGKATRLSIQYLIGAGIFIYLAVAYDQPLYALVTYACFVIYVAIRLMRAREIVGVMPGVLAKYEARIAELEQAAKSSS